MTVLGAALGAVPVPFGDGPARAIHRTGSGAFGLGQRDETVKDAWPFGELGTVDRIAFMPAAVLKVEPTTGAVGVNVTVISLG